MTGKSKHEIHALPTLPTLPWSYCQRFKMSPFPVNLAYPVVWAWKYVPGVQKFSLVRWNAHAVASSARKNPKNPTGQFFLVPWYWSGGVLIRDHLPRQKKKNKTQILSCLKDTFILVLISGRDENLKVPLLSISYTIHHHSYWERGRAIHNIFAFETPTWN